MVMIKVLLSILLSNSEKDIVIYFMLIKKYCVFFQNSVKFLNFF